MFEFTKNQYGQGKTVWHNRVMLGCIELIIKENPNIDWSALRQDKTLRVSINERWLYSYRAISSIRKEMVGTFDLPESAGKALLDHHGKAYEKASMKKS